MVPDLNSIKEDNIEFLTTSDFIKFSLLDPSTGAECSILIHKLYGLTEEPNQRLANLREILSNLSNTALETCKNSISSRSRRLIVDRFGSVPAALANAVRTTKIEQRDIERVKPSQRIKSLETQQDSSKAVSAHTKGVSARTLENIKNKKKEFIVKGYEICSDDDLEVILRRTDKKKKVNHLLHLILSIFTAGVWVAVWIMLVFFTDVGNIGQSEKYVVITAKSNGEVEVKKKSSL